MIKKNMPVFINFMRLTLTYLTLSRAEATVDERRKLFIYPNAVSITSLLVIIAKS